MTLTRPLSDLSPPWLSARIFSYRSIGPFAACSRSNACITLGLRTSAPRGFSRSKQPTPGRPRPLSGRMSLMQEIADLLFGCQRPTKIFVLRLFCFICIMDLIAWKDVISYFVYRSAKQEFVRLFFFFISKNKSFVFNCKVLVHLFCLGIFFFSHRMARLKYSWPQFMRMEIDMRKKSY